ncbi:MAG: dTMP kinase [Thermodesulfobacteriota bacterium]|nr:dTMP kinase [Thermodesulfobacteriota bacterium]
MGYLITFEGIEGCGKTTQINLLKDYFKKKHIPFLLTREPGGTGVGEQIRKILLDAKNKDIFPVTELLLYEANRYQLVSQYVTKALKDGRLVLCDRFTDATLAYQGYGHGIDLELIKKLNFLATDGIEPDLTILFDCPVDVGLKRAEMRTGNESSSFKEDRFEQKGIKFHEKVRKGYREIAKTNQNRIKIVESCQGVEEINREVIYLFESFINEKSKK